ncbi:MAG TPA: glycosyltransferase family 9 protein [Ignavibacteria bacterium]
MPISKRLNDIRLKELTSPRNVKNILIVKQHNQFGDMLCTLPLFAAVRKRYPSAFITLVVSPGNYKIIDFKNLYIDRFLIYDKSSAGKILKSYRQLRKIKYQIGIVPSTVSFSRTSHYINNLSGANIRVGVNKFDGKTNRNANLLTIKKDFNWKNENRHQVLRNLDIVKQIGCDLTDKERMNIRIQYDKSEINFAKEYYKNNFPDKSRPVIIFQPGAGKAQNRWSVVNFEKLIAKLYNQFNAYVFMICGPLDKEPIEELKNRLKKKNIECNITSQPIRESSVMLAMSQLYITNDTGTMHSAAFSGASVLSLFGPTKGWEWAPEKDNCKYIQSPSENINDISVDVVFEKAKEMLPKNFPYKKNQIH